MGNKTIKIGVTICLQEENESVWINGIKQNAIFLARMFMNSKKNYDVYIVNISSINITNGLGWDINKYKTVQYNDIKDELDILIMLGGSLSIDEVNYLRNKECKVVSYKCGNDYIISMENIIFDRADMRPNYTYVDQVWNIPQMENTNSEYWRVFFRTEVITIPFIWNPMFLDEHIKILISEGKNPYYEPSNTPKRISVFEPNINVYKFLMYPMLIAEDLYREQPDLIKGIKITNTTKVRTNKELIHLMKQLDIVNESKATFEDRFPIPWFLSEYTDIVLSHQWENALNYAYLDAVYMKYPLVHNAHLFKDAGYYYEGFNISEGKEKLLYAITEHDNNLEEYEEKSKKIIERFHSDNPEIVEKYDILIDNLLKKKNKNPIIIINKPLFGHQETCVESIKKYSEKYNIDFSYVDEYIFNEKYTHVIYFENNVLIINNNININDYIDFNYDFCGLGEEKNMFNGETFYIFTNKKQYSFENIEFIINSIPDEKKYLINQSISLNENISYFNNDSLENNNFLETIRNSKVFIFKSRINISLEMKDYIYKQAYYKFIFNKYYYDIKNDYDKYNYDSEFECFNPNKDIAFVTLYTHHIKDEGLQMEYNVKSYCEKHGHTFYIHRKSELDGIRHPCLEKPYLLNKHISNHKYIIWIDSDILLDQHFKIKTLFKINIDLVSFKDAGFGNKNLNSGFLIFRNSEISKNIINRWIFDIEEKNVISIDSPTRGDQGILNDIVINDKNVMICDNNEINVIIDDYIENRTKVVHLMGIYGFIRQQLLTYINEKIFNKII